ncbi:hypothetical protein TNCV_859591 [Trichonephila clavipes]|nr:hypothetical protein TNCV_859591 [Trichonephila clavipes]
MVRVEWLTLISKKQREREREAFKDTLEVTFQENAERYSDDKIEEDESLVNHYFDNFNTHIPPLTPPLEVRGIIKKYLIGSHPVQIRFQILL